MKAFTLALALVTVLLASPAFGQQPREKPEIPPGDGTVFAAIMTDPAKGAGTICVGAPGKAE